MNIEREKVHRYLCRYFFALYLLLLIHFMFFSEAWGRGLSGGIYRYNLVPLKEIRRYFHYYRQIGSIRSFFNLAGNIVVFMPFGMLLPAIGRNWIGFGRTALLSLELSVLIEIVQLVMQAGSCDVDDVLLNTLGGCIGYGLYMLGSRTRGKYEKEKIQIYR